MTSVQHNNNIAAADAAAHQSKQQTAKAAVVPGHATPDGAGEGHHAQQFDDDDNDTPPRSLDQWSPAATSASFAAQQKLPEQVNETDATRYTRIDSLAFYSTAVSMLEEDENDAEMLLADGETRKSELDADALRDALQDMFDGNNTVTGYTERTDDDDNEEVSVCFESEVEPQLATPTPELSAVSSSSRTQVPVSSSTLADTTNDDSDQHWLNMLNNIPEIVITCVDDDDDNRCISTQSSNSSIQILNTTGIVVAETDNDDNARMYYSVVSLPREEASATVEEHAQCDALYDTPPVEATDRCTEDAIVSARDEAVDEKLATAVLDDETADRLLDMYVRAEQVLSAADEITENVQPDEALTSENEIQADLKADVSDEVGTGQLDSRASASTVESEARLLPAHPEPSLLIMANDRTDEDAEDISDVSVQKQSDPPAIVVEADITPFAFATMNDNTLPNTASATDLYAESLVLPTYDLIRRSSPSIALDAADGSVDAFPTTEVERDTSQLRLEAVEALEVFQQYQRIEHQQHQNLHEHEQATTAEEQQMLEDLEMQQIMRKRSVAATSATHANTLAAHMPTNTPITQVYAHHVSELAARIDLSACVKAEMLRKLLTRLTRQHNDDYMNGGAWQVFVGTHFTISSIAQYDRFIGLRVGKVQFWAFRQFATHSKMQALWWLMSRKKHHHHVNGRRQILLAAGRRQNLSSSVTPALPQQRSSRRLSAMLSVTRYG